MTRKARQSVVDQLRKAIEDSGESQIAIAEATGVNQGNLSKFMRGERSLSLETFAALCEYLKVDLARRR